jgi:Helicase conserved C-terminal domain/SNF2-related domain
MTLPLAISTSRPPSFGPSRRSLEPVPIIVAESLGAVEDPLIASLRPLGAGEPKDVAGAIAGALARETCPVAGPSWLRSDQLAVLARVLPVLHRYRCALLADPVGSGKTWIALAVASVWRSPGPVTVIAPAAILTQWERTADGLGVSISLWSHERLSRGSLPSTIEPGARSLVIIDESHHFRNPRSRRYLHLAPRLPEHNVLLLSGTPVVNRLADLSAQLLLGARDDALLSHGVPSLRQHLSGNGRAATALGELVLARPVEKIGMPRGLERRSPAGDENSHLEIVCREIDRLALASNAAIASLIRTVLLRALASSDPALLGVLRRYRSLLWNARDAAASGRHFDRSSLRTMVGADQEQLVMWDLLPDPRQPHDLVHEDIPALDSLIDRLRHRCRLPNDKVRRLAGIIADGKPTIVFTGARETVGYLSGLLPAAAWCTGDRAGIGTTRMERAGVLSWFRPGAADSGGPRLLITTDVTAEGLDLQRAARVVHYDLPWTTVRIDQRNGRVRRLGSYHDSVELIRFDLPSEINRRLDQLGVLARKRRLARKAGVDEVGTRVWTWRDRVAGRYGPGAPSGPPRYGIVVGPEEGALVGLRFCSLQKDQEVRILSAIAGWIDGNGQWTESPSQLERVIEMAMTASGCSARPELVTRALRQVAPLVRERISIIRSSHWAPHCPAPGQARAVSRIGRLAGRAARARNAAQLAELERALAFCRRGHTAGEAMLLESLVRMPDRELCARAGEFPPGEERNGVLFAELTGLVIFRRERGSG